MKQRYWWIRTLGLFALIGSALLLAACATPDGAGPGDGAEAANDDTPRGGAAVPPEGAPDPNRFAGLPFPEDADWVNTDQPLTLEELEGRHILLDFWTYGCINCYHMVPNLNKLHERYQGRLVVIGVHSAKFTEEQDSQNIREAVDRYGIRYPVVNDRNMELWQGYRVPGWPTIIMIDPEGYVIGGSSGEWSYERLAGLLDEIIDRDPETAPPELPQLRQAAVEPTPATQVSFPQGLFFDTASDTLYVSDTGNNRILAVNPDSGALERTWGTGVAGLLDGPAESARFRTPRGLVVLDGDLYVADTGNHAIRRIDGENGTVETIVQGGLAVDEVIRSPWDLATDGRLIYFSNAGNHQIWRLDPETGTPSVYAGSGMEGLVDGNAEEAEFAQPSGLSFADGLLYVADPESSAVRAVDTGRNGDVTTLVGTGLFDFGFQDGTVETAQLMHVGDVEATEIGVVLADTYNNRLRILNDGIVRSVAEGLNEPKALTGDGSRLWIADTNNHRILTTTVARLQSGSSRLDPLTIRPGDAATASAAPMSFRQDLSSGDLVLDVRLPDGHILNEGSPNAVVFRAVDGTETTVPVTGSGSSQEQISFAWSDLAERGVIDPSIGRQSITLETWLYYCRAEDEDICRFYGAEFQLLLENSGSPTPNQAPATVTVPVG